MVLCEIEHRNALKCKLFILHMRCYRSAHDSGAWWTGCVLQCCALLQQEHTVGSTWWAHGVRERLIISSYRTFVDFRFIHSLLQCEYPNPSVRFLQSLLLNINKCKHIKIHTPSQANRSTWNGVPNFQHYLSLKCKIYEFQNMHETNGLSSSFPYNFFIYNLSSLQYI
jgi:hypothetical protein